ncbi:MAG: TlpA disulfide reductase family protein [Siphonobacter sp.]
MRKFIFGVFLLISTATFAQSSYTINGVVRNAAQIGDKVYLQMINDRGLAVTVDSATIQKGAFHLAGTVLEGGGFYRLNVGGAQLIILLLEGGETLQVEAEGGAQAGKVPTANVTGSKNMQYFQQLQASEVPFRAKMGKLETAYDAAVEKKDKAAQQQIQQEGKKAQEEMVAKVKAMIPEMGTSLVTLYATNFLNQDQDFEVFEQLADRFEKEKPNGRMYKAFIATVRRVQTSKKGLVIGSPAPEINLPNPEKEIVSLSSLRGKYVLIDFWAGWCGPCRRENPNVVRLYHQFKDKGFEVYGVSLDSDRKLWLEAIQKDSLTWTQVSDLKYFDSAAAMAYGIQYIPFTVLIDPKGNIIAKELRGEALEAKLKELMP